MMNEMDSSRCLKPEGVFAREGFQCGCANLCRPSGTRSIFALYPGLTSWANVFRPYGPVLWVTLADLLETIVVRLQEPRLHHLQSEQA